MVLVDIVNFTPQAAKLGNALLLFGHDPEELLEIILDIFKREKLEDKYGLRSKLRMVGHFGFFQFEMENNSPVDLVSAEGIKSFPPGEKKINHGK